MEIFFKKINIIYSHDNKLYFLKNIYILWNDYFLYDNNINIFNNNIGIKKRIFRIVLKENIKWNQQQQYIYNVIFEITCFDKWHESFSKFTITIM